MKQKSYTSVAHRRQSRTRVGLLYRSSTQGAPPPWARRQHRREAPPGRERAREDLFPLSAAAATVSSPMLENLNLDLLGPNTLHPLSTDESLAVSATSQRPLGHQRRKRSPSPPATTSTLFFAALNNCRCSRGFGNGDRRRVCPPL